MIARSLDLLVPVEPLAKAVRGGPVRGALCVVAGDFCREVTHRHTERKRPKRAAERTGLLGVTLEG